MTDPHDIRADLDPSLDPAEREKLVLLAARLREERPLPAASFRGDLLRRLQRRRQRSIAPVRLRRMVAAYTSSGSLLLAIAAIGVGGAGPFAA
jgi:hypothetical protein